MAGDRYGNYKELALHETEGEDFRVKVRPRDSDTLIMAPHGGGIEPGTASLAREIAGDEFALYLFLGMKRARNRDLHITSAHFDEPRALGMLTRAERVVTVHGHGCTTGEFVMVGGLDAALGCRISQSLNAVGFTLRPPSANCAATDPENLCNRGRTGKGVQLEISKKLREVLKKDRNRRTAFVEAARSVLLQ